MSEADIKGIPDDDPGPDESAVSPTEIEKVDKHTAERPKLCRWCTSPISSSATVCATCKGNQVWFWYYFDKLLLSVSTGVSIILVAIAWINVNLTEQNLNEAREALSIAQSAAKEALRAKEFFGWVTDEWDLPGDNIYIWDLYSLQTEGGLYFKSEYAVSTRDSHPNKEFAGRVVNDLFNRIIDVIENNGNGTLLNGEEK